MPAPVKSKPRLGSRKQPVWPGADLGCLGRCISNCDGRIVPFLVFGLALVAALFLTFWGVHTAHLAARKTARNTNQAKPTPHSASTDTSNASKSADALARQILGALTNLDSTHGPLTLAQAEAWKKNLQQLAQMKSSAAPAIRDFLEKNQDIVFDNEEDRRATGVNSLRLALIDLLHKTGGPESEAVCLAALQRTADPVEIAVLSRDLESMAPGKYRVQAMAAAREALALASSSSWDGRDVAPLLDVLRHFAGADAIGDLQKATSVWFDYAPIVLAHLPDGAGVPALISWATNRDTPLFSGNETYIRMLAETAISHPEALATLVELARANRISSSCWDGIAAALGGARLQLAQSFFTPPASQMPRTQTRAFHIASGNQTFIEIGPDPSAPSAQVAARARAIDQLLAATENPFGQQALTKAKQSLTAPR
jgi:hypothetical protein